MGKKTKGDHQSSSKEEHQGSTNELDNGAERPDTHDVNEINEQASYRDSDSVLRQTLRRDETKGDADERDVAGATDFEDTPHGREETKNDKAGAANQNG